MHRDRICVAFLILASLVLFWPASTPTSTRSALPSPPHGARAQGFKHNNDSETLINIPIQILIPPSISRPRAAILYLVSNDASDIEDLCRSVSQLFEHFNSKHRYPVIIFHEGLRDDTMDGIKGSAQRWVGAFELISFEQIEFRFPSEFDFSIQPTQGKRSRWGYHHMIRFWASEVFKHSCVRDLDFYMRLDCDSFIEAPFDEGDVFMFMAKNKLVYGYRWRTFDPPHVAVGLWRFVFDYIRAGNLQPKLRPWETPPDALLDGALVPMFYNNFEIAHIPFFALPEVHDFLEAVDRSLNIYRHRWGDACLRFFAVALFAPKERTHMFAGGFRYRHQAPIRAEPIDLVLPYQ